MRRQTWVEWVTGANLARLEEEVASYPLHMQRVLRPYVALVASLKRRLQQTPGWTNFVQGLNSPDAEQRERFNAAAVAAKDLTLEKAQPFLQFAETAKKPRGQKKGNRRRDDTAAHQEMQRLKGSDPNMSKAKAARIATGDVPLGRAKRESVEKRIARTYPWAWDV